MEPVCRHSGGVDAGGSSKKVEPGSAFAAMQRDMIQQQLHWPIKYMQKHDER